MSFFVVILTLSVRSCDSVSSVIFWFGLVGLVGLIGLVGMVVVVVGVVVVVVVVVRTWCSKSVSVRAHARACN